MLFLALLLMPLPVLALAAGLRWRVWRRGRPAPLRPSGLLALPRRFLVDLHARVGRRPRNARMHALAAGGLLGAWVLALGLLAGPLPAWLGLPPLLAAALAGLAGAWRAARRRGEAEGAALPGGAYRHLPWLLAGADLYCLLVGGAAGFGLLPAPWGLAGLALAALGGLCLGGLAALAWSGPMRHALAGMLHLAFHPRPGRFAGAAETALAPLPAGPGPFGAARGEDFAWNQRLGLEACVQCGRCEEACPAFAAGQPLSPRRFVGEIAAPGPLLGEGGLLAPETLWACTTCRACVEACPMMIEHVDAMVDLRRFETLERAATPPQAARALANLAETDTASGRALAARLDFAADLALPRLLPGGRAEVLLWIGEAGFDLRNQRSLRALIRLLRLAGVDFAVLEAEPDCGDLARRLGDEMEFARLARANVAALARLDFDLIVTMDPHAAHALAREYPAFGGHYTVSHHAAFLERLLAEGRLLLPGAPGWGRITYHDPCYLGRYLGETEAPRRLLDRLGAERVEMPRHGSASFCCGGGGGAGLSDIPGRARIPELRFEEARRTGASILAVGCPNCTQMLEGVPGGGPVVREIAELLLAAVNRESLP